MGIKQKQYYHGFEQGPIRPPSEANSLLIRVTRNCPWNHCTFCSVYKGAKFSLRLVEHVIADIDSIFAAVTMIHEELDQRGTLTPQQLQALAGQFPGGSPGVFHTAANWLIRGEGSVFLQDANSLVIKPEWLIAILTHLKQRFPWVTRVTSYARSHTINRISDEHMAQIAHAGLSRIHIGMESGADAVLEKTRKGVTKEQHITAGRRVKNVGIELSEYVMPGLGGVELSREHAIETADALNEINPDFIRLRTLAVPPGIPLFDEYRSGAFEKCSDVAVAREIRTFVAALDGITPTLKSDHFYNLLQEVEGQLPQDQDKMLQIIDRYLALPAEEQTLYQVGRRAGLFQTLGDLVSPAHRTQAERICQRLAITPDNVDQVLQETLPHML